MVGFREDLFDSMLFVSSKVYSGLVHTQDVRVVQGDILLELVFRYHRAHAVEVPTRQLYHPGEIVSEYSAISQHNIQSNPYRTTISYLVFTSGANNHFSR